MITLRLLNQLRESSYDELRDLSSWCLVEANKKDPKRLSEEAEENARIDKLKREQEKKDANTAKILVALRAIVRPGTLLKMRGCKDGQGLREFIKWEGENLVCWQILRRRRLSENYRVIGYEDTKTNQVTVHMPDKVREVIIDGAVVGIKSILKSY